MTLSWSLCEGGKEVTMIRVERCHGFTVLLLWCGMCLGSMYATTWDPFVCRSPKICETERKRMNAVIKHLNNLIIFY